MRNRRPPRPRADDDRAHRLRPPAKIDDDGHAFEAEPVAQLVLDPVAVVARDETGVVDREPEARRPCLDLSSVEQVEPALAFRRRLTRFLQLAEEAVELTGRDALD